MESPSFSTSRLAFRPPEPADYEAPNGFLWKLGSDATVQHGLTAGVVRPRTKAQIEKWYQEFDSAAIHAVFCIGINSSSTGLTPVGWITLDPIVTLHRKATFGLAVAKEHQGKGYGREAMSWLLERAFNGYGLNKVEGEVFVWNEKAVKIYTSLGFVIEGRRRQAIWQNGAFQDDMFIGILASEWRERQEALQVQKE
ncbi:GNAT family N-acetyltransferase [Sporobolomyces koalae]|uniref:GNAT family N-acetyltransferase n=1 Tax=Sporobolomyces koalae TaxID=500713 RepID=UPI00317FC37E